jgi:YVTN family beta-propeller protein
MTSCDPNNDTSPSKNIRHGAFISNEGNNNNGCVSYYNPDNDSLIVDPYLSTNKVTAGNFVQSFAIVSDTTGIIVVNGSNKIKLVRLSDFKLKSTANIVYPRHALQVSSNKLYVTEGAYQGYVQVRNAQTLDSINSIKVGYGPENLVVSGNYAFVANSGGWGQDSTVSVINTATDQLVSTIIVGKNPMDLKVDNNGDVWVLCEGSYYYDANYNTISGQSKIVKISLSSLQKTTDVNIGTVGDSFLPVHLEISPDKKTLYYVEKDGIYTFSTTSATSSSSPLISGTMFYGFAVNPSSGNIYGFAITSYSAAGKMQIYSSVGNLLKTFTVGICPNGAVFN